ncbi:MAG: hypothetical protein WA005_11750 [Candidatus Binataceae bacterium]
MSQKVTNFKVIREQARFRSLSLPQIRSERIDDAVLRGVGDLSDALKLEEPRRSSPTPDESAHHWPTRFVESTALGSRYPGDPVAKPLAAQSKSACPPAQQALEKVSAACRLSPL